LIVNTVIHILGIRHHGPGSARSVVRALDQLKPDVVLIEGPPDADDMIPFAARAEMVPPVAILVHDVENPAAAVYYPFAEFSPEWQAIRWALSHQVPVRFMDLPQSHRMAIEAARWEKIKVELTAAGPKGEDGEDAPPPLPPLPPVVERDPLQRLAEAAGFDDGERWWEHVVEGRRHDGVELFAAIKDAMGELREGSAEPRDADEPYREAWMRRTIREAVAGGANTVAVVCGAWHAPALDVAKFPKKGDDERLKGLGRRKTAATWIPWTYDRLAFASGYGAGVHSPGWYEHLWQRDDHLVIESWMSRVAGMLRGADIDCSSAHVIEAVRLSRTLATLRGRPLADLADVADATRSIFAGDGDGPMRLIARQLLVGDRIGDVPDDAPAVPLQQDLQRSQKRLRLKPEASDKQLDLDLRTDNDRERSVLLHRLRLLGIDWGTPDAAASSKGTFREGWRLRWDPGFAVKLIEAGPLGNTIEAAAGAAVAKAADSMDLASLTARLQDAMLADLGLAAAALVKRIEDVAAIATDVALLMATLPPLAALVRYGNVRQTDEGLVRGIIDGLVPRVTAGLGGAVGSLNDEAAAVMERHLRSTDAALRQLDAADHLAAWQAALLRLIDQDAVHGLVRGRSARLLLDAGHITPDDVARRLSQTLSRGTDPGQGARWMEGFLTGSGLLLIHDERVRSLVDAWVADIGGEVFEEVLPLLRRTFATFPAPERRQIGQIVKGGSTATSDGAAATAIHAERASRALPLLVTILGGQP
jgi:hypothetical protein